MSEENKIEFIERDLPDLISVDIGGKFDVWIKEPKIHIGCIGKFYPNWNSFSFLSETKFAFSEEDMLEICKFLKGLNEK